MAIDIKNWVKKQRVGDRNAKGILLEIADCGNADGYCTYGVSTIAATLEMSTRTVERGLAYLQEKDFIAREESDKHAGKFTSKNTRILIPEDDWNAILTAREKRQLRQQNNHPSDNLSDGKDTSESSDILTGGQIVQRSDCPKPSDNLSNGQNVGLNDINKDVFKTSLNTEEKESLSPRTPAREGNSEQETDVPETETFGDNRGNGISVGKMMNFRQDPQFVSYTNKIVEGLKIRHGTPARLPNRDQWEAKIEDAWHNEFSAEHCLEVYDRLKEIIDLKDGDWMLTPKYWEENLPRLAKLRREVEKLKKGTKKDGSNKSIATGEKSKRRIFKSPNIE